MKGDFLVGGWPKCRIFIASFGKIRNQGASLV
jgi:hypothetical protein